MRTNTAPSVIIVEAEVRNMWQFIAGFVVAFGASFFAQYMLDLRARRMFLLGKYEEALRLMLHDKTKLSYYTGFVLDYFNKKPLTKRAKEKRLADFERDGEMLMYNAFLLRIIGHYDESCLNITSLYFMLFFELYAQTGEILKKIADGSARKEDIEEYIVHLHDYTANVPQATDLLFERIKTNSSSTHYLFYSYLRDGVISLDINTWDIKPRLKVLYGPPKNKYSECNACRTI